MTDPYGVLSIRAARRYRWRLAGGRLMVDRAGVRFVPNRLERRRPDTYWTCAPGDVRGVRVRRTMWLVIDTSGRAETFRVFGAAKVAPRIEEAIDAGVKAVAP